MRHWIGWLALALLSFLQPPGQVAADTKLDLVVDPARFLARATSAWTDEFPLGQVQNQAYGYLFPQGLFFLLTEPLPDWVAQRLWWTMVLGVAYSGTLVLARRVQLDDAPATLAAATYALSPRILTTLTAISSEAWPVALVPWTLVPLVGRRPNVAAAIIPVALMGAVNATATIAACVPAFLYLLWRKRPAQAGLFLAGAVAVSAWWLGPLLVLGRYSPPFTEFIESATVTTAWLNPVEILRGTTSWSPFVDTERVAGHLLVAEPTFVLATCLVAALGLAGLAGWRGRGFWVLLLAAGFILLATAHFAVPLFDGPLAPFRNLHKFDPLLRLPLALGVGALAQRCTAPQLVGVVLVAATATAPAWSLRLLPQGTWDEIPADWVAAGEYLDEHAAGTRTLVVPAASFARQEWGWTRDEPIQALTSSRFVFRDAIPLVDPEAIRGLDGQVAAVDWEALRSIGVGAVVVRRDLEQQPPTPPLGVPTASFGDVDIFLREPGRDMMLTVDAPLRVDGGGEVLPLLWRELGYVPAELTADDPEVLTDTPALAARNYGTLHGQGAHQAFHGEDGSVSNRLEDYPSAGTRVAVAREGTALASSSAGDAGAFGGPDPSKSLTAAFDGDDATAWWPAPGDADPYLYVETLEPYTVTATATTQVVLDSGTRTRTVTLVGGEPRTIDPEFRWIHLTEPVGIAEVDAGITRVVEVEGTADAYFFQRLFPATDTLTRRFTTAEDATWRLSAPAIIDGTDYEGTAFLEAGTHVLTTDAETILLGSPRTPAWAPLERGLIAPADRDRLILTTRGFNDGLRSTVGGTPLEPARIDAAAHAFILPAHTGGDLAIWHAGDRSYRASLLFGGAFSLLVLAACLWRPWPRFQPHAPVPRRFHLAPALAGLPALPLAWLIRRFTLIPASWLAGGAMTAAGLWLARAPWPTPGYAGDSWLLALAGCLAVASLAFPGTSTSSKDT